MEPLHEWEVELEARFPGLLAEMMDPDDEDDPRESPLTLSLWIWIELHGQLRSAYSNDDQRRISAIHDFYEWCGRHIRSCPDSPERDALAEGMTIAFAEDLFLDARVRADAPRWTTREELLRFRKTYTFRFPPAVRDEWFAEMMQAFEELDSRRGLEGK